MPSKIWREKASLMQSLSAMGQGQRRWRRELLHTPCLVTNISPAFV